MGRIQFQKEQVPLSVQRVMKREVEKALTPGPMERRVMEQAGQGEVLKALDEIAVKVGLDVHKTDTGDGFLRIGRPRVVGRPPEVGKERIAIRLSKDVLAKFRATGKGWQARIDEALRRATL